MKNVSERAGNADEPVLRVERGGIVVDRVDHDGAHSDDRSGEGRLEESVAQKVRSEAPALYGEGDEPAEDHYRHRAKLARHVRARHRPVASA